MYRIELAPGEETVFRTIEELAVGVRNGLVTPRCRIFHNATQKWLPIEFHPHYKKALSLPAARVAEAVLPKSAHPPRIETLSFAVAPARPPSDPVTEAVPAPAAEPRKRLPMDRAQAMGPRGKSPAVEARVEDSAAAARANAVTEPPVTRAATEPAATEPAAEPSVAKVALDSHVADDHRPAEPERREHQRAEPLTLDHQAPEYPLGQHPFTQEPLTHQPVSAPLARDPAGQETDRHRVAAQHMPATGAMLRDPFAPLPVAHAPTAEPLAAEPVVAEPPAEPARADRTADRSLSATPLVPWAQAPTVEPPPAPRPASPFRPETYLPPSVRIIAEDPSVAIAPQAAIDPDRTTVRLSHEAEAVELPKISYPEITPAEEPVAERAGTGRSRRPLQVAVAILVLAAGGYLAKSFYSPVQRSGATPGAVRADRPELLQDGAAPAVAAPAAAAPAGPATVPAPRSTAEPPPAPASSGFAAALEPRAMTSGPRPNLPVSSGASVPPGAAPPESVTIPAPIAPPPADLQMDVPALPDGVPVVASPSGRNDSAMKRILRAVNGGKDAK